MKILMVCLGNICRSPLAEGIMQAVAREKGLDWTVDSAGTGGWHAGEMPDRRSVKVAHKYGIDISGQRARQFRVEDFDRFDRIYVMDLQNKRHVLQMAAGEAHREKVRLILDERYPGEERIVPDPYYDADEGFEAVYHLLRDVCEVIASGS